MKKLVFVLCLLAVTVISCKNPAASGPQSSNHTVEDTGGFVKIIPPANGITGVAPGCTLPGMEPKWKGVFIKDRKVKLSPYNLGKTEVTYELWYEVLTWAKNNGYAFANKGRESSAGTVGADPTENKNHPVTMINWRDCIVWCNAYTEKEKGIEHCVYRKSKTDTTVLKDAKTTKGAAACDKAYADMTKKGFRLPTEAEWEYAARRQNDGANAVQYGNVWLTNLNSASGAKKPIGFEALPIPSGEAPWETLRDELTRVAVYGKWWDGDEWAAQPTKVTKTAAVGSKAANALDLHDMSGNVLEWCFDWSDINPVVNDSAYEQNGIVTDPQGPASGTYRVYRGGSWAHKALECTVGYRNGFMPDIIRSYLGFRLACRP